MNEQGRGNGTRTIKKYFLNSTLTNYLVLKIPDYHIAHVSFRLSPRNMQTLVSVIPYQITKPLITIIITEPSPTHIGFYLGIQIQFCLYQN